MKSMIQNFHLNQKNLKGNWVSNLRKFYDIFVAFFEFPLMTDHQSLKVATFFEKCRNRVGKDVPWTVDWSKS